MKKFFVFILLISSIPSFGQFINKDSEKGQKERDSLSTAFVRELQVPKRTAEIVAQVLSQSTMDMSKVVNDQSLQKDQKISRMKQIGAERDKQIERLLTPEQIKKLKAIMAVRIQKAKEERAKLRQQKAGAVKSVNP